MIHIYLYPNRNLWSINNLNDLKDKKRKKKKAVKWEKHRIHSNPKNFIQCNRLRFQALDTQVSLELYSKPIRENVKQLLSLLSGFLRSFIL